VVKYLHLISGPRNISTALMYSFAQRSDTEVVDEPFYAMYFSKTNVNHPGKEDVLKAQSSDEELVKAEIFANRPRPVYFIKNMAHHIEVMNSQDFLSKCVNIFLIRNPKQLIASYAQVIDKPLMRDIGIEYEWKLFDRLNDPENIVLDSGLLLENPESVLKQVCTRTGLEFQKEMLNWSAGPKPYDGVWAPHWYANVHKSTGFERQPTSERSLPDQLKPLAEEADVYYKKILTHAIRP
jgi:Sulfotransferase domain